MRTADLVAHLNAPPTSTSFRIRAVTARAAHVTLERTEINPPAGPRGVSAAKFVSTQESDLAKKVFQVHGIDAAEREFLPRHRFAGGDQLAVLPPLTRIICPAMKEAFSEARKTMASAISSGLPPRLSGTAE
jgi:hypothetical protein